MGHYLDHHSAVLDALKNQDLNTLKLLINKDKKASVYHACLALTNSNPEIFKHMLENSLEPASTVELLLNMLDSLYEQELKNIPDETLELLFDITIKYHGNKEDWDSNAATQARPLTFDNQIGNNFK